MKTKINFKQSFFAIPVLLVAFASCKKGDVSDTSESTASSTIAVAATTSANGEHGTDSVYLLQDCGRHGHRDSVAATDLPTAITTYLTSNYAGYTLHKAFAVKNSSSTLTGYVVVIYYNDKPVGLAFDSTGNFVQVLEQREKGDLSGKGHHRGGRFEHRDGQQRDTVALSTLPTAITTYFASNFPTDTLVKAFKSIDSSIVVLSKNNGAFATVFTANGTFIKRDQLQSRRGQAQPIELSALPSVAANYLSQTYPNYVFEKAFSVSQNGALKGYVIIIDANNTKYAVEFDASGNFVSAKTIR